MRSNHHQHYYFHHNTEAIEKNIKAIEEQRKKEAERFLQLNKTAYEDAQKYLTTPMTLTVEKGARGAALPAEQLDYLAKEIESGNNFLNINRQMYDSIQNEINLRQKLITETEQYKQVLADVGDQQSKNNQLTVDSVKDISMLRDAYLQATASVSSLFSEAIGIMDEVQKTGKVTTEQLVQLQKSYPQEYTMALEEENGQLKLNVEELKKLVIAKAKVMVANAQLAADSIEATLADKEALEIAKLMLLNLESRSYWETALAEKSTAKKDAEKAYNDLLKDTIDMLRQRKEAEKEALQDELSGYKKIIDARKKMLDLKQKEADYNEQVADKNKEISDIQLELIAIQFDDSEEAAAKRLKSESDLLARLQATREKYQKQH